MNLNLQNILPSSLAGLIHSFFVNQSINYLVDGVPYLSSGENHIRMDGVDPSKFEIIEEDGYLIVQGFECRGEQLTSIKKVFRFRNDSQKIKSIKVYGEELIILA